MHEFIDIYGNMSFIEHRPILQNSKHIYLFNLIFSADAHIEGQSYMSKHMIDQSCSPKHIIRNDYLAEYIFSDVIVFSVETISKIITYCFKTSKNSKFTILVYRCRFLQIEMNDKTNNGIVKQCSYNTCDDTW